MKLPGTDPPKVQKVYCTPSEMSRTSSRTSSSTTTLVAWSRLIGGGTLGGEVRTAFSSPRTCACADATRRVVTIIAARATVRAARFHAFAHTAFMIAFPFTHSLGYVELIVGPRV